MILCIFVVLVVTSIFYFSYLDHFFCFFMSVAMCLSIISFQRTISYLHCFLAQFHLFPLCSLLFSSLYKLCGEGCSFIAMGIRLDC